ncbi:uncharacterized protein LOC143023920 isoform X1 [Oratosquilla oratoria]|uniref:uncharacterized protein LOC143023920 isoform X1 n=1 Tax=Oratosquilla oratoria TaxID=337810 RepID=UPI003F7630A4
MSFLGPYSEKFGIKDANFLEDCSRLDISQVNKGTVYEMLKFIKQHKVPWKAVFCALSHQSPSLSEVSVVNLRESFHRVYEQRKSKRGKLRTKFLSELYCPPQKSARAAPATTEAVHSDSASTTSDADEIPASTSSDADRIPQIAADFNSVAEKEALKKLAVEWRELNDFKLKLECENKDLSHKLKECTQEVVALRQLHPSRARQALKRKDESVAKWKEKYAVMKKLKQNAEKKAFKFQETRDQLRRLKEAKRKMKMRNDLKKNDLKNSQTREKNLSNGKVVSMMVKQLIGKREENENLATLLKCREEELLKEKEKTSEIEANLRNVIEQRRANSAKIRRASYVLQNYGVAQKNVSEALRAVYRALTGETLPGPLLSYTTTEPLTHFVEVEVETREHAGGQADDYIDTILTTLQHPETPNDTSNTMSDQKKALQALKTPKPEPEMLVPLKRPMEAKDAKEMAKKLIKSGAIKVPERPQNNTEKTTFKRSMGLERKLSAADKAPSGYQPFSTTHPEEEVHESKAKVKNLYDRFVTARDREERGEFTRDGRGSDGKPRQGHTIYVFGYNITEEILKKAFSTFGNIVNVNMEIEKHCGFVTFDKVEGAEKAIAEMNGSMVSGIQLKVTLARRQPVIDPINDASSSATWSTIAASHSQKGSHKDKRALVQYDVEYF